MPRYTNSSGLALHIQLFYCNSITIVSLLEVWFFSTYSCFVNVFASLLKYNKLLFIDYYLLISCLDLVYKYYSFDKCNSSSFIILSRQKINYRKSLTSLVYYRSIDLLTWDCQSKFLYKYNIFVRSTFDQHLILTWSTFSLRCDIETLDFLLILYSIWKFLISSLCVL